MRRCPGCGEPLFRRQVGAIELDGCRSCGGLWFDENELRSLALTPEHLREADQSFRAGTQPALAPQKTDACPSCNAPLNRGQHPSFPGIELAMCGGCRGVWLDDGAGTAMAGRLLPEPASAPVAVASGGAAAVSAPMGAPRSPGAAQLDDPTSTAGLPVVRGDLLAREVPHEMGFFPGVSRGFRFMLSALRLARECPKLMVPVAIGLLINLTLVAGVVLLLWAPLSAARSSEEIAVGVWIAISLLTLVGYVVTYSTRGMTVSAVDAYLKGRPPDLGVAAKDVLKNLLAIVALAVVGAIVDSVVGTLRHRRRGIIGSVFARSVAGAIDAFWTVLSFLLLPIVMIEDTGLVTALSRARQIHESNVLAIAVNEVGIRFLFGIVTVLLAVFFIALGMTMSGSGTSLVVLIAVAAMVMVAVSAFGTFVRATYYTCLYLWAVEVERAPQSAQVQMPGPLAAAYG